MHTNILKFWQHLQNLPVDDPEKPSPRVCRLMLELFEAWRLQSPFPEFGYFGHLREHLDPDEAGVMGESVMVRRGYALKKTLEIISNEKAISDGFFKVNPDEIIVGTMPPYSVGQGKEAMEYFKDSSDDEDERLKFEIGFLNSASNFGHICPDFERVVQHGLTHIIKACRQKSKSTKDAGQRDFYRSVEMALEGVIHFAVRYAEQAVKIADAQQRLLDNHPDHLHREIIKQRTEGMREVAERLSRIPAEPCASFKDAVQCVFILNCALHWTGELTSIGRLDQILNPFLEREFKKKEITIPQAQEVIDCLWVKFDEQVLLDNRMIEDHFTSADGALLGAGGPSNFDQGALTNQWMQQVTIGGVVADNDSEPTDACNEVTRMCLEAARRLPFNCPTLDLRVHKDTPMHILELATDTLLSGGAHPVLLNDDKLVPALQKCGQTVELRSARNYACDGCYETIFPGETEFSFIYVPAVDVLEKALNSGAGFAGSGTTNLRGFKASYRSLPASDIADFESFYTILEEHIWLNVNRQFSGLIAAYGCKASICPSPILSALIDGCVESGRDFYDGGAKYHMFAPLMTGISTVADSLYVVERLVFEEAKFSLEELVACLRSDWGNRSDVIGRKVSPGRAREIRQLCLTQPKFGTGDENVDRHAWRLSNSFVDAVEAALKHPIHQNGLERLDKVFGSKKKSFNLLITPGVGTFEQYNFGGSFAGATPDGRSAFMPLASDLAASPIPSDLNLEESEGTNVWMSEARKPQSWNIDQDQDEDKRLRLEVGLRSLQDSFSSWNHPAFDRFADGAPSDFNIGEDFPRDALLSAVQAFAQGKGSNVMTVTVASTKTLLEASERPFDYDLLRVRMGGWTEFFSVLFEAHRKQHVRRPIYSK
ncbi:pyruvate formate lyase family protein [uncultured Ruegeria sp.]|uniref:pyruvate formate lyase family protein n=1 Tax=uncultured Ruegeria sp. TaxID=259304 RepID=UPI00260C1BFD|nr:pyruvate formate lyase family protein [uncultured Ruegeria sp.]